MKTTVFTIAILSGSFFFYSCDGIDSLTGCGGDYHFVYDNPFIFHILDKETQQDLLVIGKTPYVYDTVRIFNEEWEIAHQEPVQNDGLFILYFIDRQKDNYVYDQLISRRYYLYFNHEDTDTIDISFKMRETRCDRQVMSYFKVSYNDSIYFDEITDHVPGIYFLK